MKFKFDLPWHDLQVAALGSMFTSDFVSTIKDTKLKSGLSKILDETCEDLDNIESLLKSFNIQVVSPHIPAGLTIHDMAGDGVINKSVAGSNNLIPRPPLQVRDSFFVVGDELYQTRNDGPYVQAMIDDVTARTNKPIFDYEFEAPSVTVFGNKLFVDALECPALPESIKNKFSEYTTHPVDVGGHNDAVFSIIKPGVLITLKDPAIYADTFPGWDILSLPIASWQAMADFRKVKVDNGGKWWAPDLQENEYMVNFVDTWLSKWVGYAKETVFDVNCLVINERLVMINNYNEEIHNFFKKHNIEYIVAPLRHRFFWDGGLHCVTNDLYRGNNG
jgi:hypothetical protein